jgi:hypothetical protein
MKRIVHLTTVHPRDDIRTFRRMGTSNTPRPQRTGRWGRGVLFR